MSQLHLRLLSGEGKGNYVPLEEGEYIIGSDDSADFLIGKDEYPRAARLVVGRDAKVQVQSLSGHLKRQDGLDPNTLEDINIDDIFSIGEFSFMVSSAEPASQGFGITNIQDSVSNDQHSTEGVDIAGGAVSNSGDIQKARYPRLLILLAYIFFGSFLVGAILWNYDPRASGANLLDTGSSSHYPEQLSRFQDAFIRQRMTSAELDINRIISELGHSGLTTVHVNFNDRTLELKGHFKGGASALRDALRNELARYDNLFVVKYDLETYSRSERQIVHSTNKRLPPLTSAPPFRVIFSEGGKSPRVVLDDGYTVYKGGEHRGFRYADLEAGTPVFIPERPENGKSESDRIGN